MHDAGACGIGVSEVLREFRIVPQKRVDESAAPVSRSGVDHHACGFVDDKHELVFIHDIKVDLFRLCRKRFRFRGENQRNAVICRDGRLRRIADGFIELDEPFLDQGLETASRGLLMQLSKALVQTHSRELLRHRQVQNPVFIQVFRLHRRLPRISRNRDRRKFRRES